MDSYFDSRASSLLLISALKASMSEVMAFLNSSTSAFISALAFSSLMIILFSIPASPSSPITLASRLSFASFTLASIPSLLRLIASRISERSVGAIFLVPLVLVSDSTSAADSEGRLCEEVSDVTAFASLHFSSSTLGESSEPSAALVSDVSEVTSSLTRRFGESVAAPGSTLSVAASLSMRDLHRPLQGSARVYRGLFRLELWSRSGVFETLQIHWGCSGTSSLVALNTDVSALDFL